MDLTKVLETLERAERAGAGGKQRELIAQAIKLAAKELMQSDVEAGNKPYDTTDVITDILEELEADFE